MTCLSLILPRVGRTSLPAPWQRLADRGKRLADVEPGYAAALGEGFDWPGSGFPAAAWLRQHARHDAGDSVWLLAEPAWAEADVKGARLMACGRLGLEAAESNMLWRAVAPLFGDAGLLLEPLSTDRWLLQMPHGANLPALAAPDVALGDDLLAQLPRGTEGKRWRMFFNEAQVVLHQHPVNQERRGRGLPPVNCLWFWGGGGLPAWTRSQLQLVYSDDPIAAALASAAGVACQPLARLDGKSLAGSRVLLDLSDPHSAGQVLGNLGPPSHAGLRFSWLDGRRVEARPWHRWRFWRWQND